MVLYLLMVTGTKGVAIENLDTNLTLSVQVAKETLLPHEPLVVTAILSNKNDAVAASVPGRWELLTGVQFKEQSTARWIALTRWWQPEVNLPPLPAVQIGPRRSIKAELAFYPSGADGSLRLFPAQSYSVRAVLQGNRPADRLNSIERSIQVLQVPESEREAYELLSRNKDLVRLLAPVRNVNDVTASPSDAETFIARFPTSVYADYLRLSYVAYSGQGMFTNQLELAARYRAELTMTNPWMLDVGWRR